MYTETGTWWCFGCKQGGSVIDLVMLRENLDFISACNFLRAMAGITDEELANNVPPMKPDKLLSVIRDSTVKPAEGKIPPEEYLARSRLNKHIYLRERGFPEDVWDEFELGFATDGELENRVVIPWRDEDGKLVTLQGRAVDQSYTNRYVVWEDSTKDNVLYGLHHNLKWIRARREMVLFEGACKVWRSWQHSLLNCCAIGGSLPTDYQMKLIKKYCQFNLVIWLDKDRAGRDGTEKIIAAMKPLVQVKIIQTEVKPDDIMEKEEFWKGYASASKV